MFANQGVIKTLPPRTEQNFNQRYLKSLWLKKKKTQVQMNFYLLLTNSRKCFPSCFRLWFILYTKLYQKKFDQKLWI